MLTIKEQYSQKLNFFISDEMREVKQRIYSESTWRIYKVLLHSPEL